MTAWSYRLFWLGVGTVSLVALYFVVKWAVIAALMTVQGV